MRSGPAVEQLVAAGVLTRDDAGALRTTRRWQAAMARAAARLYASDAPWRDLRLPIAAALVELVSADDDALVGYVEVMLDVESDALRRAFGAGAEGAGR